MLGSSYWVIIGFCADQPICLTCRDVWAEEQPEVIAAGNSATD